MTTWLINDSVIFTNDNAIPFLSIEESHGWEDYTERQFTGKTVLDVLRDLCGSFAYGFRFAWTGSGFEFQLYQGTDRSFGQTENTYVIFSPDFNNLTARSTSRTTATTTTRRYVPDRARARRERSCTATLRIQPDSSAARSG